MPLDASVPQLRALYLDLLRDCLTGLIYDDPPLQWKGGGVRTFDRDALSAGSTGLHARIR